MLALDRTAPSSVEALGGDAAWRRLQAQARPADLSHAERVTLGEAQGAQGEAAEGGRPSARAVADVRWYRAAQARHAGSAAAPSSASPSAPAARPVHAGVQAYRRTLAMDGA